MDQCVIEVNPVSGQMMFCQGQEMLETIWNTEKELQAWDRRGGKRYMVSVQNDRVCARQVTVH